jgi:hypothetical protein
VETYIVIFVVAILIAIMFRFVHGSMDHDRISQYLEARGATVIDAKWVPFGPGWVGKNKDRIYEVRYLDKEGNRHHAYCKTSGWSGVYITEDRIEQAADVPEAERLLQEENRRLREELQRLKRGQA